MKTFVFLNDKILLKYFCIHLKKRVNVNTWGPLYPRTCERTIVVLKGLIIIKKFFLKP